MNFHAKSPQGLKPPFGAFAARLKINPLVARLRGAQFFLFTCTQDFILAYSRIPPSAKGTNEVVPFQNRTVTTGS
jgi:hypothetical protein